MRYATETENIQCGKTAPSNSIKAVKVTFPVTFSKILCAHVTMQRNHSVGDYMAIFETDTHMMTIVVYDGGAITYWLAIGT